MNMAKLCNDRETFVQLPESVPIRFNYASVKWADSEERNKKRCNWFFFFWSVATTINQSMYNTLAS